MKQNIIIVLSAVFAVLAAAVPLNKRQDAPFSTTTEVVIDTIWTTTTIWVPPSVPSAYNNNNNGNNDIVPSSSSQAPSSSASPPWPPAVPTTSSMYVPPVTPVNNPPAPTSTYVPPVTTTAAPAPANPTPAAPAPQPNNGYGSSSSSQGQYTGDITYYDISVGLTSCGTYGSNSENLVALAAGMMQNGGNPNNNPLCGKVINIYYGGNVHQGTIVDTCPTCSGGSLDLTPALFKLVAPNGDGRVSGVTWSYA